MNLDLLSSWLHFFFLFPFFHGLCGFHRLHGFCEFHWLHGFCEFHGLCRFCELHWLHSIRVPTQTIITATRHGFGPGCTVCSATMLNFKSLFFLEPVKALSVKHESQIHTCSSTLWVGRWGSQVVEKLYNYTQLDCLPHVPVAIQCPRDTAFGHRQKRNQSLPIETPLLVLLS